MSVEQAVRRSEAATGSMVETRSYRTVFLVGCPRSGTTWLQLLLDQSPNVATAPETQIFAYYLDHFRKQWIEEHESITAKSQGRAGLSRLLSDHEFLALCRTTARIVLDRIAARTQSATVVLEKSPMHATLVDWILSVLPDAWILHLVRDPRDTAASLLRAGRSWGHGWAPKHPIAAARLWNATVMGAQRGRNLTHRYLEVAYEDLRSDPERHLATIYAWLGLENDPSRVAEAVRQCRLERLVSDADGHNRPVPAERTPTGFFGTGAVDGWKDTLGASGARIVEAICLELMRRLGYEPLYGRTIRARSRIAIYDGVQRTKESIDWQLQRLLWKL